MPNAFTPNNDGLNDVYAPVGNFFGINDYKLSIFNRWGERVFILKMWKKGGMDIEKLICNSAVRRLCLVVIHIDGLEKRIL